MLVLFRSSDCSLLPKLIEELYAKGLAKAEAKREKADYDIYFELSKEEAEDIIGDAEKFLVRIKEAIKEIHDKSQSWVKLVWGAASSGICSKIQLESYSHSAVNLVGRVKEEMKIPDAETVDEAIKAEVW